MSSRIMANHAIPHSRLAPISTTSLGLDSISRTNLRISPRIPALGPVYRIRRAQGHHPKPRNRKTPGSPVHGSGPTASPGADYILNQSPIRESVLESGTSTAEEARARISAQQGNGGTMRICIIPYSHSASPSASFPGLNPQSGTEPRISPPHGE